MSLKRLLFLLACVSLLNVTVVRGAQKSLPQSPSIELSESADPPAPVSAENQPVPAAALEHPADEADEDADDSVDPAQGETAQVTPAAPVAAAASPEVPPVTVPAVEVPWWREVAGFLGLADPRPGQVAEPASAAPRLAPDYLIGPGDVLGISVWRDENLTRSVVVLPDGKIAMPLVGELVAGGKTVAQLKAELERKLTRYVSDAGLTVEVKQSNSMIIYIIGRVNVPGRQMMVASTNVLQGLAMAGGLNQYARRSEVKVFRRQGDKTTVFSFNYDDVAEGRHLETNIDLQKGDVILVP